MSWYDYQRSKHIAVQDEPFYALLMAVIRQADTDNLAKLEAAWPTVVAEFRDRYHAQGGVLGGERRCNVCGRTDTPESRLAFVRPHLCLDCQSEHGAERPA